MCMKMTPIPTLRRNGRQGSAMTDTALTSQHSALSPEEQAVWRVLDRHRGRGQAVGLDAVAAMIGHSERVVQHAIAALIEQHGRPIGSAVKKPTGYFVIETEDELIESVSQLTHRITALARRVAALQRSTTPLILQQLVLELEEHAA